jgi:hypothetical protein
MPKPPRPTAQLPHDSRAFRHAPNIAFKTDSDGPGAGPRVGVIGDAGEQPAQFDDGRQLAEVDFAAQPRQAEGPQPLAPRIRWAARQRIVLGQQATEEKSNEIHRHSPVLKHLDLKGAVRLIPFTQVRLYVVTGLCGGGGRAWPAKAPKWP